MNLAGTEPDLSELTGHPPALHLTVAGVDALPHTATFVVFIHRVRDMKKGPTLYALKNIDLKNPRSMEDWFIIIESSWL